MKLSTQTEFYTERLGIEKTVELLAKSGFDAADYSCFDMRTNKDSALLQPDYKEYAKRVKELAERNGIVFNQAHAPYPSSLADEEFTADIFKKIVRSMEFASLLGAKNIVVHPKQHLKYGNNIQALKEINLEFYNSLIPYCKEYNITVCIENMWQYTETRQITYSVCATCDEFREYIKMLNSPYIKGCLDIGHANLVESDIPHFISVLGDELVALHVHDAAYNADTHIVPYSLMGSEYWENIMKALADSGYAGDLTFEANRTIAHLPDALTPSGAKFMADVGKYLVSRFEFYKNNK